MQIRNQSWPILSVLTVVAVVGGYQLGETAVAQIDPLYFEGAAAPARDVTRTGRPGQLNAYASASDWEAGYAARSADCGADCESTSSQVAMSRLDEPLRPYSDPTIEPRWERAAAAAPDETLPAEPVVRADRIGRYLDYPVNAEQAERRAALKAAALPEPDGL